MLYLNDGILLSSFKDWLRSLYVNKDSGKLLNNI